MLAAMPLRRVREVLRIRVLRLIHHRSGNGGAMAEFRRLAHIVNDGAKPCGNGQT